MRKLELMLAELEGSPLVTVLAPSRRHDRKEWDFIRVNVSVPPKWYRKMCGLHASKRGVRRGKFDTIVRREHTISALERLIARKPKGGLYEERVLTAAKGLK